MNQRRYSGIMIWRLGALGSAESVVEVPITEGSKRKYTLMTEDSLTLSFSLATPVKFLVGDFVEDELFGTFYITKEQMPSYDATTGGYNYDLVFEAPYYLWRNRMLMMVANGIRKEANWKLTADLATHAGVVISNLDVIAEDNAESAFYGYSAVVLPSAAHRNEYKYIQYSGKDIITALNAMAEAYGCEWWVSGKVLYFGKCEDGNDPIVMTLGDNVETMEIQDGRSTYANTIYAFGGTKNVPYSYRRQLVFAVNRLIAEGGYFEDTLRRISAEMIDPAAVTPYTVSYAVSAADVVQQTYQLLAEKTQSLKAGTYTFSGDILFSMSNYGSDADSVEIRAYLTSNGEAIKTLVSRIDELDGSQIALTIPVSETVTLDDDASVKMVIAVISNAFSLASPTYSLTASTVARGDASMSQAALTLTDENGNEYAVTLNVNNEEAGGAHATMLTFDNGMPQLFGLGSNYTLNLDPLKVPASYWQRTDYDSNTVLQQIGERRIYPAVDANHPVENPHHPVGFAATEVNLIEETIAFDEVYPMLMLKVTEVSSNLKNEEVTLEDGTKYTRQWTQWFFKVEKWSGGAFVFDEGYILEGEALQANFVTPEDAGGGSLGQTGFKLAGMTFDVDFTAASQQYRIVRNENYGASLPNAELAPSVGDAVVLTGWNPQAMASLGLIADAESRLNDKIDEYLAALKEGNYTFTCHIMSDFGFRAVDVALYTSANEPIEEAGGAWFYVRNDRDIYVIPTEGARVKINHNALPSGYKVSRVIGYEFKLDYPWDSPTYVIGETQAYSRLAKIEKEITKLQ